MNHPHAGWLDFSGFFDYSAGDEASTEGIGPLASRGKMEWRTLLSYADRRTFGPGEEVLQVGDVGRALYLVSRGTLEVLVGKPGVKGCKRVSLISKGSIFGELAFFDAQARSATVRSLTDGELHVLSFDAFERLANDHPELARAMLLELGRTISQRLRHMTAIAAQWIE